MKVLPEIVFFSPDLFSGRARFRTLRKSEVFARILLCMYAWKRETNDLCVHAVQLFPAVSSYF
jgi:hypothetical protein